MDLIVDTFDKKDASRILNPQLYTTSVLQFLEYFHIRPSRPDVPFLTCIIERFSELPYENISKIIKLSQSWDAPEKIRLPETVIDEHVSSRLGGTCFSLTFFLQTILTSQNFICYPVMCHMNAGPNVHCSIVVLIDGVKYLIDPGYLLNRPMAIEPLMKRLYLQEYGGVELVRDKISGSFDLYTFRNHELKWRYRFDDVPCPADEFLSHWQASFTRSGMHDLCLTQVTAQGMIYVRRKFMRETTPTGKKNYNLKQNLHATIEERFGISMDVVARAEQALTANLEKERELGIWVPRKPR